MIKAIVVTTWYIRNATNKHINEFNRWIIFFVDKYCSYWMAEKIDNIMAQVYINILLYETRLTKGIVVTKRIEKIIAVFFDEFCLTYRKISNEDAIAPNIEIIRSIKDVSTVTQ